jgi:hypothetical protein
MKGAKNSLRSHLQNKTSMSEVGKNHRWPLQTSRMDKSQENLDQSGFDSFHHWHGTTIYMNVRTTRRLMVERLRLLTSMSIPETPTPISPLLNNTDVPLYIIRRTNVYLAVRKKKDTPTKRPKPQTLCIRGSRTQEGHYLRHHRLHDIVVSRSPFRLSLIGKTHRTRRR